MWTVWKGAPSFLKPPLRSMDGPRGEVNGSGMDVEADGVLV